MFVGGCVCLFLIVVFLFAFLCVCLCLLVWHTVMLHDVALVFHDMVYQLAHLNKVLSIRGLFQAGS